MILSEAQRKKSQRERTAKHRARVKAESANDLAANEQRSRDEFDSWRVRCRVVSPGEIEAFQDAANCADALTVAREFLIALGQPDIEPGESLNAAEKRVITAWCAAGAPLLNRNKIQLVTETASTESYAFDFDTKWIPLPGSNELIDVSALSVIEIPAVVEVPTVEVATSNRAGDPALKQYPTPEVAEMCRITQAAIDAEGRKMSAKNLERELERERRLGDAYVPASEINFGTSR